MRSCPCPDVHDGRRVVLTGGPGAGKTAVLELVRQAFCSHVHVLPEAAGIVFGGGFPRRDVLRARRAAQRAIFHVQRELEASVEGENHAMVLCDRGTVDGVAYWPGPDDLWEGLGTTLEDQVGRYFAVVHLRTPGPEAYTNGNPLRIETAAEAAAIDERIARAWAGHPRLFTVPATPEFLEKVAQVLALLRAELPECCAPHAVPMSV